MANTLKPKRSNTASLVPTTSNLASGELGVNMADKKVYINNGTSVVQVGAGNLSALSDVSTSSPTNGQVLSFNGTAWVNANASGGSGGSNGMQINSATVSASYSIPSGSNAISVGPITVAAGQTVTVPAGSRWVIV